MKNQIGEPMFNNLMTVVKLILSLPHSSAAAERVFSQLSMIKNRLRNRLAITTCSYILALKENIKTGLQLPPKNEASDVASGAVPCFSTPGKNRKRGCPKSKLCDGEIETIRSIIHNFYIIEKKQPTLKGL
jgi:hypothetical protein